MVFALRALISIATKKSQAAVEKLTKTISYSSKTTEKANRLQLSSWQRLGASMKSVAKVGAGLFAAMVAASPALQVALLQISYEFQELFRVLGDDLAPIIEDTLLPAVQKMTDLFIALPQPIRLTIAVTIALTVVVGALAFAVGALMAVSWPVVLVIFAIVAAVVAVIWIFQNWSDIMSFSGKVIASIVEGLGKIFGALFEFLKFGWLEADEGLLNFIDSIAGFFTSIWNWLADFFTDLGEWFYNWGKHLVNWFLDGLKAAWGGVTDWFSDAADEIASFFGFSQPPEKGALKDIDTWGIHAMQRLSKSWQRGMNLHLNPVIKSTMPDSFRPANMAIPAASSSQSISLTINIDSPVVRSDSDIDEIVNTVREGVLNDILYNTRGVIQ